MICRNCLTGYGVCVSWSDVYEDKAQRNRALGDMHWTGTGAYWVTVDPHNGVIVHHAKIKTDIEMSAVVCAAHLAYMEYMKMQKTRDAYRPPRPRSIDPTQEMLRQQQMLQ